MISNHVFSADVEVVQVVVDPTVVVDVTVERITVKVLKKMRPWSASLGASAAWMAATQAKRRRQAILKLIFFWRLFELLLRAEMLVDAICRTAIDYLYPTIAPDRILLLTVTLYLINLEQIAYGFILLAI